VNMWEKRFANGEGTTSGGGTPEQVQQRYLM